MTPRRRTAALLTVLAFLVLAVQSAQATIDPTVDMNPASPYTFTTRRWGPSATKTVTVTNPGPEDEVFSGAPTLAGANPGQFSIANNTLHRTDRLWRQLLVRRHVRADRDRDGVGARAVLGLAGDHRLRGLRHRHPGRVDPVSAIGAELRLAKSARRARKPVTVTNDGSADLTSPLVSVLAGPSQ